MRAEITIEFEGRAFKLAMPIGGLEAVAEVNPYPVEVTQALQTGVYRLDELKAVLAAGCEWGGASVTAQELIEGLGVKRAAEVARDLMIAAFADNSGNCSAAGNETTDTASAPTT